MCGAVMIEYEADLVSDRCEKLLRSCYIVATSHGAFSEGLQPLCTSIPVSHTNGLWAMGCFENYCPPGAQKLA